MSNIVTKEAEVAFRLALEALERSEKYQETHPHVDFRTATRRVLGRGEWRSDEDRIHAAEAKRQRKLKRNVRDRRP